MEVKEFGSKADAEKWLSERKGASKFLAFKKSGGFVAVVFN